MSESPFWKAFWSGAAASVSLFEDRPQPYLALASLRFGEGAFAEPGLHLQGALSSLERVEQTAEHTRDP